MVDQGAVLTEELELAAESARQGNTIVLVEGNSDREALRVLARRLGKPLETHQTTVVAMAGATNIHHFLDVKANSRVFALCDDAERGVFEKAFDEHSLSKSDLFTCTPDLESEMIAALGPEAVLDLIETAGEANAFRRMQAQPAQRERALVDQLHRFIGTRSGRKFRYAHLAAEAVDLDRAPVSLSSLIARL